MNNKIVSAKSYKAEFIIDREVLDGKLHIYELTFNNKIVFKSGKSIVAIHIDAIQQSSIINKRKGFIMKKDDKMILLRCNDPKGAIDLIFNVKDDKVDEILEEIERLKGKQDTRNRALKICYMEDNAKEVIIDPWSEHLHKEEESIWAYSNDGRTYIITIFRIMIIDEELMEVTDSLPLQELDDVIVMNTYRSSVYTSTGLYTGYANRFFAGSSNSYSSGKSRIFGDIIFLRNGKPEIIFKNIQDPNGLAKLIKSIKKQLYYNPIICKNCNARNPSMASFCNSCGYALN